MAVGMVTCHPTPSDGWGSARDFEKKKMLIHVGVEFSKMIRRAPTVATYWILRFPSVLHTEVAVYFSMAVRVA